MDYYARHEPSSPLPILLKRAKRLVGADFMEIINDLAPSGVDNVKLIGGVTEEETVTATEEASSDW
jgi:type VI secretion system protein ImpA